MGPSKQLKQRIQTEHNIVKNPNWPEANQLAIYKRGRGFEFRATEKHKNKTYPGSGQSAGLEPGIDGLQVRQTDHSSALPPNTESDKIVQKGVKTACGLFSHDSI